MIQRLPIWFFLTPAIILIALGLMPILRVAFTIDTIPGISSDTITMLLLAGLMSGLSAMILMVRRLPQAKQSEDKKTENDPITQLQKKQACQFHACGLLMYSGIPLANFLLCFYLWQRNRNKSAFVDHHGKQALNFQIAIYLYLLLSLFLVFIIFGLLSTPIILAFHLIATLIACLQSYRGKIFNYPANIKTLL